MLGLLKRYKNVSLIHDFIIENRNVSSIKTFTANEHGRSLWDDQNVLKLGFDNNDCTIPYCCVPINDTPKTQLKTPIIHSKNLQFFTVLKILLNGSEF